MSTARRLVRTALLCSLPVLPACGTLGLSSSAQNSGQTPPNAPNATAPGVRVANQHNANHPGAQHQTSTKQPANNQPAQPGVALARDAAAPTDDFPADLEPPSQVSVARVSFAEEGADFDPAISRDGSHIVFASTQHRRTSDIYLKRVDSRVVTQLTTDPADDEMPALSPDGNWIAFASNRSGNWDIYVMPATGGQAMLIAGEPEDEIAPSWSPDGSRLVYSRRGMSSGRWEMWAANVSNPTTPVFLGYGLFPKWSPVAGTGADGGDRILFQLPRERGRRGFGLWTIDLKDGVASHPTEIVGSATRAFINPAWSPDGRWIVFAEIDAPADGQWRRGARPSAASLWMVGAHGDGRVRLTSGLGVNLSPTWGSGDRLFFVSDRAGADNIWVMDLAPAIRAASAGTATTPPAATLRNARTTTQPATGNRADNKPVANVVEQGTIDPR